MGGNLGGSQISKIAKIILPNLLEMDILLGLLRSVLVLMILVQARKHFQLQLRKNPARMKLWVMNLNVNLDHHCWIAVYVEQL